MIHAALLEQYLYPDANMYQVGDRGISTPPPYTTPICIPHPGDLNQSPRVMKIYSVDP